jgi:hypothetical protein
MCDSFDLAQFYADIRGGFAVTRSATAFIAQHKLKNKFVFGDLSGRDGRADIDSLPVCSYMGTCYLIKNNTIFGFTSYYGPAQDRIMPIYQNLNELFLFVTHAIIYNQSAADMPRNFHLSEKDYYSGNCNDQCERLMLLLRNGFAMYY